MLRQGLISNVAAYQVAVGKVSLAEPVSQYRRKTINLDSEHKYASALSNLLSSGKSKSDCPPIDLPRSVDDDLHRIEQGHHTIV